MRIILSESQMDRLIREMTKSEISDEMKNINLNPTDGQKKAGNYKMGHINVCGFNITIENPKGSCRRYKNANGTEGKQIMKSHYGYFTKSLGKDGDAVDVFVGPHIDNIETVYVVDQNNRDGEFDESKVMLGFDSEKAAKEGYMENYSKGWRGFRSITGVPLSVFKKWLYRGRKQRIPFADYVEMRKRKLTEAALDSFDLRDVYNMGRRNPITPKASDGYPEYDGWKPVRLKDGSMTMVNAETGKPISDMTFDWVGYMINGFAIVTKNGQYNYISPDGRLLLKDWVFDADEFNEDGTAEIKIQPTPTARIHAAVINTKGEIIG